MDPVLVWVIVGAVILGGIMGAFWAWNRPDPNPNGLLGKKQSEQDNGSTIVQSALLATVVAVVAVLFQLPSISIDLAIIFQYASDIVNLMMPIIGVGAGISFGFALVAYIIRLFRNIF